MIHYPINNLYNFIHIPNHSLMILSKTDFNDTSCHNLKTVDSCNRKDCPLKQIYFDQQYCKEHHITKDALEYECIFNCRRKKTSLFRRYKVTGKERATMTTYYTKNTMKLYLHYVCGKPSEEGMVGPYNIEQVASILNVSDKTIRKQNEILEKAGIISVLKNTRKNYWVVINNYKESHMKSSSGGKGGFLQLSKEQIQDLIDTDDINALRLKIQLYLWTMNRNTINFPRTLDAIKNMLPSYINCKKKLKSIIDKVASSVFFDCNCDSAEDFMKYSIPETVSYSFLQKQYSNSYKDAYDQYMEQNTVLTPIGKGNFAPAFRNNVKEKSKFNTLIQLIDRNEFNQYINACVRYGIDFMDTALYHMSGFIRNTSYAAGDNLYDKSGNIIENLSSYVCYVAKAISM